MVKALGDYLTSTEDDIRLKGTLSLVPRRITASDLCRIDILNQSPGRYHTWEDQSSGEYVEVKEQQAQRI